MPVERTEHDEVVIQAAMKLAWATHMRSTRQPIPLSTEETQTLAEGFLILKAETENYETATIYDKMPTVGSDDPIDGPGKDRTRANSRQVGGEHYGLSSFQHWDMVALFQLDYFQGQITKYVMRWRAKNGISDLEKAAHFLQKYIELSRSDNA